MTFSYTASVPQTPAYDGAIVTSPDPVFRKLTIAVDVHYPYQGVPGSVTVSNCPLSKTCSKPMLSPRCPCTTKVSGCS